MTKSIFMWLLILLLLIVSGALGLELFGNTQYKPSIRFRLTEDTALTTLRDENKAQEDKIKDLETRLKKLEEVKTNPLTQLSSSIQNGLVSTHTPNPTLPTGQPPISFQDCITLGGLDESGVVATSQSGLCVVALRAFRPAFFDLRLENVRVLELVSGVSTKLQNERGEVFVFNGSGSFFDPTTTKVGDQYKVTGRVKNENNTLTFESLISVEKVV